MGATLRAGIGRLSPTRLTAHAHPAAEPQYLGRDHRTDDGRRSAGGRRRDDARSPHRHPRRPLHRLPRGGADRRRGGARDAGGASSGGRCGDHRGLRRPRPARGARALRHPDRRAGRGRDADGLHARPPVRRRQLRPRARPLVRGMRGHARAVGTLRRDPPPRGLLPRYRGGPGGEGGPARPARAPGRRGGRGGRRHPRRRPAVRPRRQGRAENPGAGRRPGRGGGEAGRGPRRPPAAEGHRRHLPATAGETGGGAPGGARRPDLPHGYPARGSRDARPRAEARARRGLAAAGRQTKPVTRRRNDTSSRGHDRTAAARQGLDARR